MCAWIIQFPSIVCLRFICNGEGVTKHFLRHNSIQQCDWQTQLESGDATMSLGSLQTKFMNMIGSPVVVRSELLLLLSLSSSNYNQAMANFNWPSRMSSSTRFKTNPMFSDDLGCIESEAVLPSFCL